MIKLRCSYSAFTVRLQGSFGVITAYFGLLSMTLLAKAKENYGIIRYLSINVLVQ